MTDITPLDWQSPIEKDGQGGLLDEGDFNFQITQLVRTNNRDGFHMAKLTVYVHNGVQNSILHDYLVLKSDCEWKLCQFFTAIGQRQHGQKITPNWAAVEGSYGKCHVIVESYTKDNGQQGLSNKIGEYLKPQQGQMPRPDQPPQPPPYNAPVGPGQNMPTQPPPYHSPENQRPMPTEPPDIDRIPF